MIDRSSSYIVLSSLVWLCEWQIFLVYRFMKDLFSLLIYAFCSLRDGSSPSPNYKHILLLASFLQIPLLSYYMSNTKPLQKN